MLKRSCLFAVLGALLLVGGAQAQYPILDMIAQRVIEKYQSATCEQLWEQKGKPESPREQEAIQMLRGDPQMASAFLNKVAGPIATKMFECGMIP